VAVKQFIMNAKIVVGVGNIYASESLFLAGINPKRAAGRISLPRYDALAASIRAVLERAIRAGGTTLRDYYGGFGDRRRGPPPRKRTAPRPLPGPRRPD